MTELTTELDTVEFIQIQDVPCWGVSMNLANVDLQIVVDDTRVIGNTQGAMSTHACEDHDAANLLARQRVAIAEASGYAAKTGAVPLDGFNPETAKHELYKGTVDAEFDLQSHLAAGDHLWLVEFPVSFTSSGTPPVLAQLAANDALWGGDEIANFLVAQRRLLAVGEAAEVALRALCPVAYPYGTLAEGSLAVAQLILSFWQDTPAQNPREGLARSLDAVHLLEV